MLCDSCDACYIQGVKCHEHGCPDAWKDEVRECKWCGTEFTPTEGYQDYCSEECAIDYHS